MKKLQALFLFSCLLLATALQIWAAPPTVQSRYLAFSNVQASSANLSFTRGNGAGRIVVVHYGGTVDWNDFLTNYLTPLDVSGDFTQLTDANGNFSTAYSDNDNRYFASSGTYVVIDILTGTERTSSFSSLSPGYTYNVRVFEYNSINAQDKDFNTNTATNNPRSFTTFTLDPPSELSISQWSEGGLLSWSTDGTNAAGYKLTILQGGSPVSGYDNLDIGKPSDKKYPIFGLTAGQSYTYSIRSYDNNGNLSSAATDSWTTLANPGYSSVTFSPGDDNCAKIGDVITATLTAQNNQWGLVENTTSTINGQTATFTDNGDGTYTFTYTVATGNTDRADNADVPCNFNLKDGNNIAFSSAYNGSGNSTSAPAIDANAPTVTNVTSTTADGTYGIGADINIQVQFNETVVFTPGTGDARITLNSNTPNPLATRNTSQTGTTLDLTYTVQEGDVSSDLDYVATNSLSLTGTATIRDACGNDANLNLPAPGSANSLAGNKNIVIDGVRPTVSSIIRQSPSNPCTNVNSVTFRVTFSEPIQNSSVSTADFTVTVVSGSGSPSVTLVTPLSSPNSTQYDVDVDVSSFTTGEIRLDFDGTSATVLDVAGNANSNTYTFTAGQTYQIDHDNPTASVSGTSGQCYTTAPTSISGTASDVGCGGVNTVEVAIWVDLNNNGSFDGSDGYYNGTNWTSMSEQPLLATYSSGNWSFTLPSPLPNNDARYYVQVRATDGAGNIGAWTAQNNWYFVMDNTNPTIASGTITVPTTGTCWNSGSHTIQWTAGNITDVNSFTISLDYSTDGGSTWNSIASGLSNSGIYTWNVPTGLNSTNGVIRITATDCAGNTTSQISNTFTFDDTPPSITTGTITAPASGTCWNSGSHTIQWTTGNITDVNSFTISLDYSTDGGSTWNSIATGLSNSGSYNWTVPTGLNSTNGVIRITATDCAGNTTSQISNTFTFDDTPPSIATGTITAPTTGTCWNSGSHTIQWTTGNITDVNSFTISLDYSTDGGSTWNSIATGLSNSGSYNWNVPTGLNSTNGVIRITAEDCAGNTTSQISNTFTFDDTPPSIATGTITAPTTGTCWNSGSHTIQWTTGNITDANSFTISLDYSTDGGSTWNSIATGLSNSGSHTWNVPNLNTNAIVRITATDCAGNFATQNSATFIIDNTPPTISVTYPTMGTYTNGNQVVQFTANDNNTGYTTEARLIQGANQYGWTSVTSGSTQISSLYSWSSVNEGSYDIEFRVTDCAGNQATTTVTGVIKDVTPPTILSYQVSCASTSGTITFSEGVYSGLDANGNGTGALSLTDISVTASGGSASLNTATINHSAGATTATTNLTWTGTLNGFEQVQVQTQNSNEIYDLAGNAMTHPTSASDYTNVTVTIVSNPTNQSGCVGTTVNFSGSATGGAGLQYQWQESTDGGSTWNDISNGGVYSGATTATLTLTGITNGMNNYKYRLKAYNECDAQYTNAATLTVTPATAITTQPQNTTICEGSTAYLSVSAVGGGLSYQWQFWNGSSWVNVSNGTPSGASYTGGTSANLQISGLAAGSYDYRVIVYGSCSPLTVTSNTATVQVDAQPSITGNPSNSTICAGGNTTFSVISSSGSIVWQVSADGGSTWSDLTNSGPYGGVYTNTLTITGATAPMNGYQYRLKATNGVCSPVYSNPATLTVNTAPTISTHPSNATQCFGSWSQNFSVTASGATSYQWQYWNGSSWVNVSDGTPVGATYTGANTATLTVTSNNIAAGTYQYQVVVTNSCGSTTSNSATLTVNPATVITTHPSNATICEGTTSQSFSVAATGFGTLTYQWQFSSDNSNWSNVNDGTPAGATYSGQTTNTLTVYTGSIADGNNYYYRCVVSAGCGTVNSNSAQLTITPATEITSQPNNQTACGSGSINVSFSVGANGTSPITYQWQYSADGSSWSNVMNNTPSNATYTGGNTSTLNIQGAIAAGTYYYRVQVSSACGGTVNSNSVTLTVTSPATVSGPTPTTITKCQGAWTGETFTITASNYTSIQWQYSPDGSSWSNVSDGTPSNSTYSGANTTTLTINSTGSGIPAGTYYYRAQVTGCQGTIYSTLCTLTVNPLPGAAGSISGPTSITAPQTGVSYSISPVSDATSYNWSYSGTGVTINNNGNNSITIDFSSGATSGTLTVTPINACGSGTPSSLNISVTPPPTPTKLAITTTIGTQVTGTPFNITVESQDDSNNPAPVSVNTTVGITVNTGSGSVSGSGTISAGNSSTTISVTYTLSGSDGETGVIIQANATGLTSGVSNDFTVLPTEPTTQASGITLSSRTQSTISVSFAAGNGAGRLVAATTNSSSYGGNTPTDGTSYSIGDGFGTNTTIINKGNVTTATVTGLSPNQWATFRVFEYNGNLVPNYNTSTASNNPRAFKTLPRDFGEANFKGEQFALSEISPNPVADGEVSFFLISPVEAKVTIEIVNSQGNVLSTQEYLAKEGVNDITIFLYNLQTQFASGLYFVRVSGLGETLQQPFIYLP